MELQKARLGARIAVFSIQSCRQARQPGFYRSGARLYSSSGSIPASKKRFVPTSGTYPQGFRVSGTHVGVKPSNKSNPDLGLVVSERPCSAAAVFTQNRFQAAPVTVSKQTLSASGGENIHGVVVNAGNANAVTGKGGLKDAQDMAAALDKCFDSKPTQSSSLVMSTGVIGQRLPIAPILEGIPKGYASLASTHEAWLGLARSICTTDTFPKLVSSTFSLPSDPMTTYSIAGISKGAGMIHPNMATLLGIIATDAPIEADALRPLLKKAIAASFNCISIDGDSSTNDTIALLANGAAAHVDSPKIEDPDSPDGNAFLSALTPLAQHLAQLVVRDGEGATKFVRARVTSAPSAGDARVIASMIARSPLVKTAIYGKDANWGRVLMAVGNSERISAGAIVPERVSVTFRAQDDESKAIKLLVEGEPQEVDEVAAKKLLEEVEDLEIWVGLGTGTEEGSYWFCDFSKEYVAINADYRT